ncbi:MAG TPA: hypothetical protein VEJ87_04460 [Acidimicrobiales bacterium]|nr:hypothetical protein [Acidimicrobiales bacterium]
MFIWFILAIGLLVIVIGGYGGQRKYRNARSGGAVDNPKSHNPGHTKERRRRNSRGRGSAH